MASTKSLECELILSDATGYFIGFWGTRKGKPIGPIFNPVSPTEREPAQSAEELLPLIDMLTRGSIVFFDGHHLHPVDMPVITLKDH